MNQPAPASMGERQAELRCYVHVPYCAARCGYCDFNTYVPGEAGRGSQSQWRGAATAEVRRAREHLAGDPRPISSIFFGGGTPTLLPVADLAAVIEALVGDFSLTRDAEISVEANPENVTPGLLDALLDAGVTRLSLGMQSADPAVLAALDRRHQPLGAVTAARLAQVAGFDQVSLDLIYGTPGETPSSWRRTLAAAVETGVTHLSAYALKIEPGTALHRRVQRGDVPPPDDDEAALAYEIADATLTDAGLTWYEISNWAQAGHECRHNVGYWTGDDWWGIGPGAHSHVAGTRWWNHRHPAAWIAALQHGETPVAGSEVLTPDDRLTETVMLQLRLSQGLDLSALPGGCSPELREKVADLAARGLVILPAPATVHLTLAGRRLADAVTLELLDVLGQVSA